MACNRSGDPKTGGNAGNRCEYPMSFFSDLFEGNFGNLGTDIVDAPSSLINHPDELAETLGGAALIGGGLAFGPELFGTAGADFVGSDVLADTALDAGV